MLTIEVTADDIAHGCPRKDDCCPVARALNRVTGRRWCVLSSYAERDDGATVGLPLPVTMWVLNYDLGLTALPFAFQVREVKG